jgi:hypothetical protein
MATQGITADTLNQHYAQISTDCDYRPPALKRTVAVHSDAIITEWRVFKMLDQLHSTATGPDNLPAWYLRLAAPIFAKPLADLLNMSLSSSEVPSQWKQARIHPIPKVSEPMQPADFRPISITIVVLNVTYGYLRFSKKTGYLRLFIL